MRQYQPQGNRNQQQQRNPMSCTAHLSSQQRRILRAASEQESDITRECSQILRQLSELAKELHDITVESESNEQEQANKCIKFMTKHANMECTNANNWTMNPEAIQMAMTSNCICIQATCFRVMYKWIPKLDTLRMKLLKIKRLCIVDSDGSASSHIEKCSKIQKTVHKLLQLKTAS